MKGITKIAVGIAAAGAAQGALAEYFYRRTMVRQRAKVERTTKMAGTDWAQYKPLLEKRKEAFLMQQMEVVYVRAFDGLKLHGTFVKKDTKKVVICFHGYTSKGMNDFIGLSDYYLRNHYSMLLVDERAHGESEGTYIGFGCLDRMDALRWIEYVTDRMGEDVQIILHGISMGGATVLMTSGLQLPSSVRGIISDCGFTSAKEVFASVLKNMYHLPPFLVLPLADRMNQKRAGYGLDECNAAREVKKAQVPILLIHGEGDTFVPCWMCDRIYENCASEKKKLIVKGAAHAESYYKDTEAYEKAMDAFLGGITE